MKQFTIRATLITLVVLSIAPAIVLSIYEGGVMHSHLVSEAEQQSMRIARGLAATHDKMAEGSRALLSVLSKIALEIDLKSPKCGALMASIMKNPGFSAYTASGFFSPQGDLICNSLPAGGRVNVADREWFQRTVAQRDFASEGYQVGRTSGRPMIPFGYPVIDREGKLIAVAILALSLDWLEKQIAQTTLPATTQVVVLDEDGTVLAHFPPIPELIGKPLPVPWLSEVLGAPEGVIAPTEGGHKDILVAHVPFRDRGGTVLVVMDKSTEVEAASAAMRRQLLTLLAILTGGCAAAWFGSRLIVSPIAHLIAATRAIGSGRSLSDVAIGAAPIEFHTLLCSFGAMAEQLKAREDEVNDSRRHLETLIGSVGEGICGIDREGRVTFANPEALRLLGWGEIEFVDADMHALTHHTRADGTPNPAEECPMKRAAQSGTPAKVSDDIFWRRDGTSFDVEYTVAPLISRKGLEGAVVVFRDITTRKRQEYIIAHMAGHDPLTDLPNRKLFEDRLAFAVRQARRNSREVAVLFLDLDSFKPINDSLGHAAGDLVLKEVSSRLIACVRETDTVARVGGDEFIALLTNLDDDDSLGAIADKMIHALNVPIDVGSQFVSIGVSIGGAIYPSDGETEEEIVKKADAAMYIAKSKGRNRYRFAGDGQEAIGKSG